MYWANERRCRWMRSRVQEASDFINIKSKSESLKLTFQPRFRNCFLSTRIEKHRQNRSSLYFSGLRLELKWKSVGHLRAQSLTDGLYLRRYLNTRLQDSDGKVLVRTRAQPDESPCGCCRSAAAPQSCPAAAFSSAIGGDWPGRPNCPPWRHPWSAW